MAEQETAARRFPPTKRLIRDTDSTSYIINTRGSGLRNLENAGDSLSGAGFSGISAAHSEQNLLRAGNLDLEGTNPNDVIAQALQVDTHGRALSEFGKQVRALLRGNTSYDIQTKGYHGLYEVRTRRTLVPVSDGDDIYAYQKQVGEALGHEVSSVSVSNGVDRYNDASFVSLKINEAKPEISQNMIVSLQNIRTGRTTEWGEEVFVAVKLQGHSDSTEPALPPVVDEDLFDTMGAYSKVIESVVRVRKEATSA